MLSNQSKLISQSEIKKNSKLILDLDSLQPPVFLCRALSICRNRMLKTKRSLKKHYNKKTDGKHAIDTNNR